MIDPIFPYLAGGAVTVYVVGYSWEFPVNDFRGLVIWKSVIASILAYLTIFLLWPLFWMFVALFHYCKERQGQ